LVRLFMAAEDTLQCATGKCSYRPEEKARLEASPYDLACPEGWPACRIVAMVLRTA